MRYLAIVSVLWAFSFGLIGSALAGVDAYFVATARLGCATLLFLPWLRPKAIGRQASLRLIAIGAIQFGLMYVCYMKAFEYLPSHLVALFSILTPVYVVLIHDISHKRFSPHYLLAALLSVTGAAAIKIQGAPSGSIWIGFGLMQLAGLSFAYGQLAYRAWKRRHPSIHNSTVFALLTLGGTICAGAFSVCFADRAALVVTPSQWQAILYLGCIASGLGFFLWNKGAVLCNAGVLAAFNNAVVPLAVFFSLFVFGEIAAISTEALLRFVFGGLLVGMAVVVGQKQSVSLPENECARGSGSGTR
jgi:drug/metabolite transporter (DMT)-like permease